MKNICNVRENEGYIRHLVDSITNYFGPRWFRQDAMCQLMELNPYPALLLNIIIKGKNDINMYKQITAEMIVNNPVECATSFHLIAEWDDFPKELRDAADRRLDNLDKKKQNPSRLFRLG